MSLPTSPHQEYYFSLGNFNIFCIEEEKDANLFVVSEVNIAPSSLRLPFDKKHDSEAGKWPEHEVLILTSPSYAPLSHKAFSACTSLYWNCTVPCNLKLSYMDLERLFVNCF